MSSENTPKIADTQPTAVNLEAGKKYAWCACGLSKSQPFCDGSHKGSGYKPTVFTAEKSGEAWLCMCKQTSDQPFCDGTHATLEDDDDMGEDGDEEPSSSGAQGNAPPAAKNTPTEPHVEFIHTLAQHGLDSFGDHGPMTAMGVPRTNLPAWDDIQILTAQLATKPLLDDTVVGTDVAIGPNAQKPLKLNIPLFVSDMSFGSLSFEAKLALSRGAELAGTGICSGEGGMLGEEQEANSRYFYELASAQFGYHDDLMKKVQAFHFKGGQAAKTGTGGHLPGTKVTAQIAEVRGVTEGEPAVSPATFIDMNTPADFQRFADRVRKISGGVPIGFKLSANHIEEDIDFALEASADYIILDGRGGGTGAAPTLFRDHISVPTLPALARARRYLNLLGRPDVTLIVTGGLRVPSDFIKALCLGADAIALANSAIQAVGCVGARMCNTNMCPTGIATQNERLRKRLNVDESAQGLHRFLMASTQLMQVMARACGHVHLNGFSSHDITTWKKDVAELTGIRFAGI